MKYSIIRAEHKAYSFFKELKRGFFQNKIVSRLSKIIAEIGFEITRATHTFGGTVGITAMTHSPALSGVGCCVLLHQTLYRRKG